MSGTDAAADSDAVSPTVVFGRPPTRPARSDRVTPDPIDVDTVETEPVETEPAETEPVETEPAEAETERVEAEPVPDTTSIDDQGPLVRGDADLRQRWDAVQVAFVDDPRRAVEAAAGMVDEAAAALQAEIERRRAEVAGSSGLDAEVSTDELVAAFQRYRDLFDRVLSA